MVEQVPAIDLQVKAVERPRIKPAQKIEHGLAGPQRFSLWVEVRSTQRVRHVLDEFDCGDLHGADLDTGPLTEGAEVKGAFG